MARKPRFNLIGVPQHVMQRGINCEACFFTEQDYQHYLRELRDASLRTGCHIHAYTLMTNHVHLLVTPCVKHGVSHLMQSVGRRYTRYIHTTYGRTDSFWERRYRASLVESARYLLACYRYIELDPVRAGIVRQPEEYPWSSYSSNAGIDIETWLTPHSEYRALGRDRAEREQVYRALFVDTLEAPMFMKVREALRQEQILGSARFKDIIESVSEKPVRSAKGGQLKVEEKSEEYCLP